MKDVFSQWSKKHSTKLGTFAGWLQQGASAFAALLVVPVIIRTLSAEEAGMWYALQGFLAMTNLIDLGLGMAVSRQAAFCIGKQSKNSTEDFLNFGEKWDGIYYLIHISNIIKNSFILIAFIIASLLFEFILPHTKLFGSDHAAYRTTWYLLTFSSLLTLATSLPSTILTGIGKIYLVRLLTALYFLFSGLAVMACAITFRSLPEMACGYLLTTFLYFYLMRRILQKSLPSRTKESKFTKDDLFVIWNFLKIALPMGFINVGSFLVSYIQTPLVGSILGPTMVAPFYLAQKIGQFLNQAARQMIAPQINRFTSLISSDEIGSALKLMKKTIIICSVSTLFANIAFYFCTPILSKILANEPTSITSATLALMAIDYTILGLAVVFGYFVLGSGKNPFVWSTILSGFLNLGCLFFLLPKIGLLGIPLSSLISGLLTNYWFNPYHGIILLKKLARNVSI